MSNKSPITVETFRCHYAAISDRTAELDPRPLDHPRRDRPFSPCEWGELTPDQIKQMRECPKHREERLGPLLDRLARDHDN